MGSLLKPSPIIVCGIGPIGARVAATVRDRIGVAALVDIDPDAARQRMRELGGERPLEPELFRDSLADAVADHPGAPVALCTSSNFEQIVADVETAAAHGSSVVTTCEEALWPFERFPELARDLSNKLAESKSSLLGVGINPGFLMDLLPTVLATAYDEPDCITVERQVDIRQRRGPLQRKVGLGMTLEEFNERKQSVGIGHRGLDESMHFVAAALGVGWDRIESDTVPVVAEEEYEVAGTRYPVGSVVGMHNFGQAWLGDRVRLKMDLEMSLRIRTPIDRVTLDGAPPLPRSWNAPDGVPGDEGTAHVVQAALWRLAELPPGLCTLLDVPGGLRGCWR